MSDVLDSASNARKHALVYDAQGNLATKDGQVYQFDFGNRLSKTDGKSTYYYDA